MSPNRRIALNFIASYGRSVYAIVIGLFCGRWTLMALGEVDYGLMGLIAGLTALLSFFNSLMANAVGRFFAFSVGQTQNDSEKGLETCRRWFNVALLLHVVIPILGVVIGYPVGVWAIENYLAIPVDRVGDCIWVWRWVCLSCFLSMVTLPFNAMYQAKQYIAELTVYSFVTITLNACFLYYMVTHPGVWLVKLTFWSTLLTIAPQLIIAWRAIKLFPECRFVSRYMWDVPRMKELFVYASYRFFGAISMMIERQGMDILVNKVLGPAKNAAMNVGGTVSGHCNCLAGALLGAISPAITNAYGAGDRLRVQVLANSACKYSAVMVLVFVLPLLIEAEKVFDLWLDNPPEGAVSISLCLMGVLVLENLSCGLYMPIFADGRIRGYQISVCSAVVLTIPLAWALLRFGWGLLAVGYARLVVEAVVVVVRLYFSHTICGLSILHWVRGIFVPLFFASTLAVAVGVAVAHFLAPTFARVVLTTVLVNLMFLPLVWLFVFAPDERLYCKQHILSKYWFTPWAHMGKGVKN